jgi:hypothetical protein
MHTLVLCLNIIFCMKLLILLAKKHMNLKIQYIDSIICHINDFNLLIYIFLTNSHFQVIHNDAPLSSLMDSTASPKMKTTEGEGVGTHSLACNTLKVKGRAGTLGWGLRRLTSKSITHMDLHKLNDKLVNAQLEHLWCMDKLWANMDSQDSSQPELEGNHHLPPYSIFCAWPRD